jgi:hypothetical protein
MKKLDHPIMLYMVITTVSFACAYFFFKIGGSLAEVTGNDTNPLGFGFKAGGAIAGFMIIFVLSRNTIEKFYEKRENMLITVKVYLLGKPTSFARNHTYAAEYRVFDGDTGDSKEFSATPFWEAGFLTVIIKDVGDRDFLTIRVKNGDATIWESESFHSRSPKVADLTLIN